MASPSAPPPPPPPPPHGEGSSKRSHSLEAFGIDPGTMAELYLYAHNASCYEDIRRKLLLLKQVKPDELEDAARALLNGYYAVKEFVENKIEQSEVEVSALEHRLDEMKQMMEITRHVPLADAIKQQPASFAALSTPIPNRIYKDRLLWSLLPKTFGPYEHVDRIWQDFLEGKTNPQRLEVVARSLAPGPLRNAFSSVGPRYGMSYFENQKRLNEVELDAARRTLREFRILRDVHNMQLVEAYSDKIGKTTTHDAGGSTVQEGNTRKDKGKKPQKSPKKKGDK